MTKNELHVQLLKSRAVADDDAARCQAFMGAWGELERTISGWISDVDMVCLRFDPTDHDDRLALLKHGMDTSNSRLGHVHNKVPGHITIVRPSFADYGISMVPTRHGCVDPKAEFYACMSSGPGMLSAHAQIGWREDDGWWLAQLMHVYSIKTIEPLPLSEALFFDVVGEMLFPQKN